MKNYFTNGIVVAWMRNVFLRPGYLNIWLPVTSIVWGSLRSVVLLEEVCYRAWLWEFKASTLPLPSASCLQFEGGLLPVCCLLPWFPTFINSYFSGTSSKINSAFQKLLLVTASYHHSRKAANTEPHISNILLCSKTCRWCFPIHKYGPVSQHSVMSSLRSQCI